MARKRRKGIKKEIKKDGKIIKEDVAQTQALTKEDIDNIDYDELAKEAKQVYNEEIIPEKIEKTIEVIEDFEEIIETEQQLVELFNEERFNLDVVYKNRLLKFKIKPITEGDDLSFLDLDLAIYSDMSEEEAETIEKVVKNEKLSKKDEKILEAMDERQMKKIAEKGYEMVNKLLAQHVTPPDYNGDLEKRYKFWEQADFILKELLVKEVTDRLGIDGNQTAKLFQAS